MRAQDLETSAVVVGHQSSANQATNAAEVRVVLR
jgi:hypothetical protein